MLTVRVLMWDEDKKEFDQSLQTIDGELWPGDEGYPKQTEEFDPNSVDFSECFTVEGRL